MKRTAPSIRAMVVMPIAARPLGVKPSQLAFAACVARREGIVIVVVPTRNAAAKHREGLGAFYLAGAVVRTVGAAGAEVRTEYARRQVCGNAYPNR